MKLAAVDYSDVVQPASGSWLDVLAGIVKPVLDGEIARRYGGGSGLADRATVNAFGEVRPAGQPATAGSFVSSVGDLVRNPWTWAAVGVVVGVGVLLARR
jgi:hypothetical protein